MEIISDRYRDLDYLADKHSEMATDCHRFKETPNNNEIIELGQYWTSEHRQYVCPPYRMYKTIRGGTAIDLEENQVQLIDGWGNSQELKYFSQNVKCGAQSGMACTDIGGYVWFIEIGRKYYHSHREFQNRQRPIISHEYRFQTQCKRGRLDIADADWTPYPPIIVDYIDPLSYFRKDLYYIHGITPAHSIDASEYKDAEEAFIDRFKNQSSNFYAFANSERNEQTQSEGNNDGRWGEKDDEDDLGGIIGIGRCIRREHQIKIHKNILQTHEYFAGGMPRPRPFVGWFYKEINKAKERLETLKILNKMKKQEIGNIGRKKFYAEGEWLRDINIFKCHSLTLEVAIKFELEFIKMLDKSKNKFSVTDKRERRGIMPSESDYFPLNDFTMRSDKSLDGRYINEEFELEQYLRLQENLSERDRGDKMLKLFEIKT